jgi:hypothetical protein
MLQWNCSTSMGILNERELIAAVRSNGRRGRILGETKSQVGARAESKHNKKGTKRSQNAVLDRYVP